MANQNRILSHIEISDIKDENLRNLVEHTRLIKALFEGINTNVDYLFYYSKREISCVGVAHLLSAECSMDSIENCVLKYHFSDAGTILRKLRDDLLQFLVLYVHIKEIGNKAISSAVESGKDILTEILENDERNYVEAWLHDGSSEVFKKILKSKFGCSKYMNFLRKDLNIKKMLNECFDNKFDEIWLSFNERLNGMVHTNGRKYILMNTGNKLCHEENKQYITGLREILDFVSVVFFSFLMMIGSSVIRSSYHVDCLDCGEQPPENSQFWIMQVAQEFVDKILKPYNKKLAQYISIHNSSGMQIKNCG